MSGSTTWPLWPPASEVISALATIVCAVAAAVIDMRTRRIPNFLTLGGTAVGFGLAVAGVAWISPYEALAGFVLGGLLLLPGHVFGATGAGDVKLLAAFGALLGPARIFEAFLFGAVAGGVLAVLIALRRGRFCRTMTNTTRIVWRRGATRPTRELADPHGHFSYGPALALGALLVLAIGG